MCTEVIVLQSFMNVNHVKLSFRYTKPQSFSDCVGDELPYGWEEVYDPQVGVYYVDHTNRKLFYANCIKY